MISQKYRFHGRSSLKYVFANGNNERSDLFSIKWITNPYRKHPRVAVIVSKKVYKSAVKRNKIRRRIYTITQPFLESVSPIDIAVNVYSPDTLTISQDELSRQLLPILDKIKIETS